MKRRFQSLCFLAALGLFLVGVSLSAQQAPPDTQSQQPAGSPSQTPNAQDQQQPAPQQPAPPDQTQPPDTQAQQAPSAAEGQSFVGTIVKSGDKYVFQDAATGNTYDIDHQDQVQKYEGKKVKVHGALDESTKTIHLQ